MERNENRKKKKRNENGTIQLKARPRSRTELNDFKKVGTCPALFKTRCQKDYLKRPPCVETKDKKQEEKKLNRKNWQGNLLISGLLRHSPPPARKRGGGGGGGKHSLYPLRNYQELVLLSQMQLISKQFYIEFRKKTASSIKYRVK